MASRVIFWTFLGAAVNSAFGAACLPRTPFKLIAEHKGDLAPSVNLDFPDPSIIQIEDGSWVAVATEGNGRHLQVATTSDLLEGEWSVKDYDLLPENGWTNGENFWAPDIRRLNDKEYIIYFSGRRQSDGQFCIGVARSEDPVGPYTHDKEPLICAPEGYHGVIDASGFKDPDSGKNYVIFKYEGDASGPTGGTPILIQEIQDDAKTLVGEPTQILDRIGELDGPLVEAPNIVKLKNSVYVLFFSTHLFTDPKYDVNYAYSKSLTGPYTRAEESLIEAPDFGLKAPGGMTSNEAGDILVFHGWCREKARCTYAVPYKYEGSV
ncbi:hypothetical protein N0V84_002876 [Fusarium piperis]|uniref:Endo-1,5-alpha-L-arabinanase A n=1 Tax=Fusarium piperis TaxID=1435070 RepID=A0A9W8WJ77_9HYPO|nr:hypothetical protein N0V84_002876 [Fusarium piperis]